MSFQDVFKDHMGHDLRLIGSQFDGPTTNIKPQTPQHKKVKASKSTPYWTTQDTSSKKYEQGTFDRSMMGIPSQSQASYPKLCNNEGMTSTKVHNISSHQ